MQADLALFETELGGHVVHSSRPPSLYSPSRQAVQLVSTPFPHAETYPSPTPHVAHGTQADPDSFGLSLSPQVMHALSPPTLAEFALQASQVVSLPPTTQPDTKPSPRPQVAHGTQADCDKFGLSLGPQVVQELSPPTLTAFASHASQIVSLPPITQPDTNPSPKPQVVHGTQADCDKFGLSLEPHAAHEVSPPTLTAFESQASQIVSVSPATQDDTNPSPKPHTVQGIQAVCSSFGLSL